LLLRDYLVDTAAGPFLLNPFQEARHRRAVTGVGSLVASHFDSILDRLRKHRRVAAAEDARTASVERLGDRSHRPFGIDRNQFAAKRGQIGLKLVSLVQPDAVTQVGADLVADLLALDEQVGGSVCVYDRKGRRARGGGMVR